MNADEFLRHYDRVADAQEAVTRLRRFVLDLAVRGKLVPQDDTDDPASNLLASIAAERAHLGVGSAALPVGVDEMPFPLPSGWSWSRIGEVCSKTGSGSTPRGGQAAYKHAGIPFLRSQNIYDDGLRLEDVAFIDADTHARMAGTQVRPKDLLLNITGGSIGRCCRVPDVFGEANVSQHVAILRLAVPAMADYLHRLVLSPYFQRFVEAEQTGAGRGGLPKGRMDHIAVAVPPLAEQRRIVAKVDELMALCDRLEAARAEREAARDRLTAASLARLNTPDPETFDEDTRFALAALPSLSTHSEQMDSLRQAIRNLGVQGKLTRQDVNEEPGAVLLAKISESKAKLTSRRGGRSATSVSSPGAGIGIDLPPGWAVARWEDIALKIGDIDHKMPDQVTEGIPYVSPRDFGPGNSINFEGAKRISRADFDRLAKKIRPQVGDIIFPRYGTIGENRLVDDAREFLASYSCCVIKVLHGFVDPGYQFLYSISDVCRAQARAAENKTTQANVGIQSIKDFLVPLPPLAEQRRIVLRVNQLMTVCDQLEASLAASAAHRIRLLEALLRSALEPTSAERHAGATDSQAA